MRQFRFLGTVAVAVAVAVLLVASSVAVALPGHFGPREFDNYYEGTAEDDTLGVAGDSRDLIIGRAGNDVLHGYEKRDVIHGNAGNDAIDGGSGSDYGTPGAEYSHRFQSVTVCSLDGGGIG